MLIGLFVIPSGLRAAHDKLAPLFVELYSSVGIIIGVLLQKTWNIDGASNKDNTKALVGYPESLMILLVVMILTYNIAMRLMQSRWWRCIKTTPPDPGCTSSYQLSELNDTRRENDLPAPSYSV